MDIILGAGVTGISYAKFTPREFVVLERENEIGGYCRTVRRHGFVWDYSGHFFHFQDPEIKKTVFEKMNLASLREVEKHTQILYNGRYIDFPFQKNIHQLEKEEFIDCLYDLFTAEAPGKDGFKDMLYGNYGRSISDKFLIPYNEKLYACDLNSLDREAMGRFFPKAGKEDIVKNFRQSDNRSYNSTFTYPSGGAEEYVRALASDVPTDRIVLGEEAVRIDKTARTVYTASGSYRYDNLISTLPFPVLLDKCGMAYGGNEFSYNKVLVFNLGFDRKGADRVNHWIYVPDKDIVFYRFGYYDNILGTDRMSLYVEIGFSGDARLSDEAYYLDRVLKDLRKLGVITGQTLTDYHAVLMDPAYVHINNRSRKSVEKYKRELAQYGIYSIGRYGSWTYCSIEDNIKEARELARKLQ